MNTQTLRWWVCQAETDAGEVSVGQVSTSWPTTHC
jgi:hypothetical protein